MLNMYPYFDFAFYASGGVLDAIQTNLSEFQFYQESDFEDYLESMKQMRKMGGFGNVMNMLPSLGAMGGKGKMLIEIE